MALAAVDAPRGTASQASACSADVLRVLCGLRFCRSPKSPLPLSAREKTTSHYPFTQLLQRILRPPPDHTIIAQGQNHGTNQRVLEHHRADRVQQEVIGRDRRLERHSEI